MTIHVESLWTNRAELSVEAEFDNPHANTNTVVISMLFEAARFMASEARGENERALFSQEAMNQRHRELDEREIRLDERDTRLTVREGSVSIRDQRADEREAKADEREAQADFRERDQMEREVEAAREPLTGPVVEDTGTERPLAS